MNDTELTEKYRALVKEPLAVASVERCNFRPHPFTIGLRHVAHAHDGRLGQDTCKAIPCAEPHCHDRYEDHVSDHVLFVKPTRTCTEAEVSVVLMAIKDTLIADGIDGVAFVRVEGFDIIKKDGGKVA